MEKVNNNQNNKIIRDNKPQVNNEKKSESEIAADALVGGAEIKAEELRVADLQKIDKVRNQFLEEQYKKIKSYDKITQNDIFQRASQIVNQNYEEASKKHQLERSSLLEREFELISDLENKIFTPLGEKKDKNKEEDPNTQKVSQELYLVGFVERLKDDANAYWHIINEKQDVREKFMAQIINKDSGELKHFNQEQRRTILNFSTNEIKGKIKEAEESGNHEAKELWEKSLDLLRYVEGALYTGK